MTTVHYCMFASLANSPPAICLIPINKAARRHAAVANYRSPLIHLQLDFQSTICHSCRQMILSDPSNCARDCSLGWDYVATKIEWLGYTLHWEGYLVQHWSRYCPKWFCIKKGSKQFIFEGLKHYCWWSNRPGIGSYSRLSTSFILPLFPFSLYCRIF